MKVSLPCAGRLLLGTAPLRLSTTFLIPSPFSYSHSHTLLECEKNGDGITKRKNAFMGATLRPIGLEKEDDSFLSVNAVPTFVAQYTGTSDPDSSLLRNNPSHNAKRLGLEALVPGAFLIEDAFPPQLCNEMVQACEDQCFGHYSIGKNNHGAMQVLVSSQVAQQVTSLLAPFVDMESVNSISGSLPNHEEQVEYGIVGVNKRWRVYRYEQGGKEQFAPHIDAGFPPSSLSADGERLIWDALGDEDTKAEYDQNTVSRLTVLMYLNDDFEGGHTNFYAPASDSSSQDLIASVKPRAGSILLFPQAVGEEAVDFARLYWPLHEGSPVQSGNRPKYVIRSDVLFTEVRTGLTQEERDDPLWKNDELVREVFQNKSPALNPTFLRHVKSLYNPHMGVENVGPLLYSLVRFTKTRKIVEIGAGYTTLWLLQALKDNDDEILGASDLQEEGNCRLLDIPWTVPDVIDNYNTEESSLLCIDNCLHQRETATGAGAIARTLGLADYLKFIKGDAFAMDFDEETIDLLWCDFGVGARAKEFVANAWRSVRPGGFLVCHSTLTNQRTRSWLEAVRNREDESSTGMPSGEYVELSLLEPHKRYQNSITILQRRRGHNASYEEPIRSEYA